MLGDADEEGLFREAFGVHVTACRDAVCQLSLDRTTRSGEGDHWGLSPISLVVV